MNGSEFMSVLRQAGVLAPAWGNEMVIARQAFDPSRLVSGAEVDQALDSSLLRWPYFSMVRHGATPEIDRYTLSRNVIGHQRDKFADPVAIRELMSQGATLKLNKLSDWHRPTRTMREALEADLPVAVACYLFWTPPENRGMLPHRDGSHVLALQLEGRKKWKLYAGNAEDIRSSVGTDVDSSNPSHEFELSAGDLLYLPQGWAHDAVAVGENNSLHLTFTLSEPSPENLLDGFRELYEEGARSFREHYHPLDLPERCAAGVDELLGFAKRLDDQEWLDHSLRLMRKNAG